MSDKGKIILLKDLLNNKKQKEKELEYYQERLGFLKIRVSLLQSDIDLTNKIIKMIESESIVEVDK